MQRLVAFLLVVCLLSCTATIAAPFNASNTIINDASCNLPAPEQLVVTDVTTNSIDVQWNDVPGATGYAVEARNAVTQQVYAQFNVTTNTATCDGLPSGTPILVEVAAICSGGAVSMNKSSVEATTDFIIELVINGYTPCDASGNAQSSNGSTQCGFTVNKDIDYSGTITTETGTTHKFIMRYVPRSASKDPVLYVRTDGVGPVEYTVANSKARITFKKDGAEIAKMSYSAQYTNSDFATVFVSNIKSGYNFNWDECGSRGMYPGSRQNEEELIPTESENGLVAVAPNPFTDHLLVTSLNHSEPLLLQLYDLKGGLVQSWNLDSNHSVSNEFFIPDLTQGIYLLRAVTPQKVETHLLINKVD